MKRAAILMLAFLAAFTVVACGGNTSHKHPANEAHHEHVGAKKEHGKKKIGTMDVALVQYGEAKQAGEGVFEVNTGATPEDNEKAKIYIWLGDKDGKEISPKIKPEWAKAHNDFDGHVEVSKDAPAKAWLWVEIDGNKASWEIEVHPK